MCLPRVPLLLLLVPRFLGSAAHVLLPHSIISEVDGTWRLNESYLFRLRGSSPGASGGWQYPMIEDVDLPGRCGIPAVSRGPTAVATMG